jgi:Tol biopolymer transport system component
MKPLRTRRPILWAGPLIIFIFLLQAACNMPSFAPAPSATAVPATLAPTVTSLPPTATATQIPATPTATTPPPATKVVTVTPSITSAPKSQVSGVIAYDQASKTIIGVELNGVPLDIKLKLSGADWLSYDSARWANDSFYYANPTDKSIVQIAKNGAAKKLAFIPAKDNLSFAISTDGKKIAWSFDVTTGKNPASELWVANLDGTGAKQVAAVDAASNTKWLVLKPYRWLPDGRLLYIDEPTGIGGYILFYGFAGLHVYDPAASKLTNLTPSLGAGSLCLLDISPDLKSLVSSCASSQKSDISLINLTNSQVISLTRQTDQNVVGSPAWSPSGAWMAYAYARGNPDDEKGSIALVAAGASTPKILASVSKGYFNVAAWVNEDQFIVQRYEGNTSSIWLFKRDGSAPVKLSNGAVISLIYN